MYCPKCLSEYLDHINTCVDCSVKLLKDTEPLRERNTNIGDFGNKRSFSKKVVFESHNQGLVALAKSLLQSEEIHYTVKNEYLQNFYGLGSFSGFDPIGGKVQLCVMEIDFKLAKEILKKLPH